VCDSFPPPCSNRETKQQVERTHTKAAEGNVRVRIVTRATRVLIVEIVMAMPEQIVPTAGFLLLMLLMSAQAMAQEQGQAPTGFKGLNSADQPPPGFTYVGFLYWYSSDKFKDTHGNVAPVDFEKDIVNNLNIIAYTPQKKVLGATYSASVGIPTVNAAVTIPVLDVDGGGVGFGEPYSEPFSLGWALPKGKVRAGYGFVAPIGSDSKTSDYWGHQVRVAGTYNPDKEKLWQLALASIWELHQKKRHEDLTIGNNVTFDYGVGKTFVTNGGARVYQLGVVGYAEFQLTLDKGTAVVPPNLGNKDRVFAMGPGVGMKFPQKKFGVLVRVLPEFGARSKTEGCALVFQAAKSF